MSQLPGDTSLPIFVYGALKPDEISWPIIKSFVTEEPKSAELFGHMLVVIDGVPTIEPSEGKHVFGSVVQLGKPELAYAELADFENVPGRYVWREVEVGVGAVRLTCNALALAKSTKTRKDEVADWSASDDAYFGFAIPWSYKKLTDLKGKFDNSRPPGKELYDDFLDLQSVFMILWTLTERLILFRVRHTQPNNLEYNVHRLSTELEWAAAAEEARIDTHIGIRSNRDPLSDSPTRTAAGGFKGWYEARNNVVHRGKGAFKEATSLELITIDMHNTLAILLQEISPSVNQAWRNLTKAEPNMQTSRLYVIKK